MVNPEVQNYINQSRASGMTDDQIRSALSAQGRAEADVSAALGSGVAAPAVGSSVVAGTASTWLTGKVIGLIIVLLIVLGVGGYFFFAKKSIPQNMPSDNQLSNNQQVAVNGSPNFSCKDILSESEFKSVTGYNVADFEFDEYLTESLICSYSGKVSGTVGLLYHITVYQEDKDLNLYFPDMEKPADNPAWEWYNVSIDGVGSRAYYTTDKQGGTSGATINVLSSNKKYVLVVSLTGGENNLTIDPHMKLARVIDNNLSNL